ncbi:1125_t:CDS:2, partial [Gigaspora rosea]
EINESQIKPKKRKMSYKRSKKEWVIGQRKNKWEENKENLVHDNTSSSSITPMSKILKMRENEVEDVSPWIKRKNKGGWITAIGLKHLKNMIAPEKKTRGKKESEVEHALEKNQNGGINGIVLFKKRSSSNAAMKLQNGKRAGNQF